MPRSSSSDGSVASCRDLGLAERLALDDRATDLERLAILVVVDEQLGEPRGIAERERDRGRTAKCGSIAAPAEPSAARRSSVFFATRYSKSSSPSARIFARSASTRGDVEPAVLGDEDARRAREAVAQLGDFGFLL